MKDELVKVFRFEYFDRETRSFKVSVDWAVAGAVESMGAVLLPETAREVPAGEISFSGLWRCPRTRHEARELMPPAHGPPELVGSRGGLPDRGALDSHHVVSAALDRLDRLADERIPHALGLAARACFRGAKVRGAVLIAIARGRRCDHHQEAGGRLLDDASRDLDVTHIPEPMINEMRGRGPTLLWRCAPPWSCNARPISVGFLSPTVGLLLQEAIRRGPAPPGAPRLGTAPR